MFENEQKDFTKRVERLIARIQVAQSQQNVQDLSIEELKNLIRIKRSEIANLGVVQRLTTELMIPSMPVLDLVTHVHQELMSVAPIEGLGIIILGSSAHGGWHIAQLTGREDPSDLDYGLISSDISALTIQAKCLKKKIAYFLDRFKKDYGFHQEYQTCHHSSGRVLLANINGIREAIDMLNKLLGSHDKQLLDKILIYFHPSIPAALNEGNRRFLLEALNQIYKSNESTWRLIVDTLYSYWIKAEDHQIKKKHFGNLNSQTKLRLAKAIELGSTSLMAQPFKELLESTKTIS